MSIMICSRLHKSPAEASDVKLALEIVRRSAGPGVEVFDDSVLDWDALKLENYGHDGAYACVGASLEAIVLIEGREGRTNRYISRGQYSLAATVLAHGGRVLALRGRRLVDVCQMVLDPNGSWATNYAVLVVV